MITLKKLPSKNPVEAIQPGRVPKDLSQKMYDVSKLKLEKFHKVLHYIVSHVKGKQPKYV